MQRKLIIPMILVVLLTILFSGCSNNKKTEDGEQNSTEQSISTPDFNDLTYQNETPDFVYIYRVFNRENCDEEFLRKPEDIEVFTTAIETGTPIDVPSEVKPSPYVVELNYPEFHDEYFFYTDKNSGWAYGHGLGKAIKLSKQSLENLNHLDFFSSQHAENAAIGMVVKNHPEFPDKAGIKEVHEVSDEKEDKIKIIYETKIEKKTENIYTVTLTKTWGIEIEGTTPVCYWKYDISPEKMILTDENSTGEKLVENIK